MSFHIDPARSYGEQLKTPEHVDNLAQRILKDADYSGRASLSYRARFITAGYAEWSLELISVPTCVGSELLDASNADALRKYEFDWVLELEESAYAVSLVIPLTDDTEALLYPSEPFPRELFAARDAFDEIGNALELADNFADYPIFDEDDYYQREQKAWDEELAYQLSLSPFPESDRDRVAEWVTEAYYGQSEPGWVNPDWIEEACTELGVKLPA